MIVMLKLLYHLSHNGLGPCFENILLLDDSSDTILDILVGNSIFRFFFFGDHHIRFLQFLGFAMKYVVANDDDWIALIKKRWQFYMIVTIDEGYK